MVVDETFVFGIGIDQKKVGFLLKGKYDADIDNVSFEISYFNGESKIFLGKASRANPAKKNCEMTITGEWHYHNDSSNNRDFGLTGTYGPVKSTIHSRFSTPNTPKSPVKSLEKSSTEDMEIDVYENEDYTDLDELDSISTAKEKDPEEPKIEDLGAKLEEKMISWQGVSTNSSQPDKKITMCWEDFQINPDKTCLGMGEDLIGEFEIEGIFFYNPKGEPSVSFEKYYIDEQSIALSHLSSVSNNKPKQIEGLDSVIKHTAVVYPEGWIRGTWVISKGQGKDQKGEFEMKGSGQDWNGYTTINGTKLPLVLNIIIEEDFAYGVSCD